MQPSSSLLRPPPTASPRNDPTQARPRSRKSRDAFARNQLSSPIDRRLPSCDFETQSQCRNRPAFQSMAQARLAHVFAEKTPAKVAKVIRLASPRREKSTSSAESFQALLPANPVSFLRSLSRPSLRAFANPVATALPVSSETKTVDATLHRM